MDGEGSFAGGVGDGGLLREDLGYAVGDETVVGFGGFCDQVRYGKCFWDVSEISATFQCHSSGSVLSSGSGFNDLPGFCSASTVFVMDRKERECWGLWFSDADGTGPSVLLADAVSPEVVAEAVSTLCETISLRATQVVDMFPGWVSVSQVEDLLLSRLDNQLMVLGNSWLVRKVSDRGVDELVFSSRWDTRLTAATCSWVPVPAVVDGLLGYGRDGAVLGEATGVRSATKLFLSGAEWWAVQDLVRLAASVSVGVADWALRCLVESRRLSEVVWDWWRFYAASGPLGLCSGATDVSAVGVTESLGDRDPGWWCAVGWDKVEVGEPAVGLPTLVSQVPTNPVWAARFYNSYVNEDGEVAERFVTGWSELGEAAGQVRPVVVGKLGSERPGLLAGLVGQLVDFPCPGVLDCVPRDTLSGFSRDVLLRNLIDPVMVEGLLPSGVGCVQERWLRWQVDCNLSGLPVLLEAVFGSGVWSPELADLCLGEFPELVSVRMWYRMLRRVHSLDSSVFPKVVGSASPEVVGSLLGGSDIAGYFPPAVWEEAAGHRDFLVRLMLAQAPVPNVSGLRAGSVLSALSGRLGDGSLCVNRYARSAETDARLERLLSLLPAGDRSVTRVLAGSAVPAVVLAARQRMLVEDPDFKTEFDEVTERMLVGWDLGESTRFREGLGTPFSSRGRLPPMFPSFGDGADSWRYPPAGFENDPVGWWRRVSSGTDTWLSGFSADMVARLYHTAPEAAVWLRSFRDVPGGGPFERGWMDDWDWGWLRKNVPASVLFSRFPTSFAGVTERYGLGVGRVVSACDARFPADELFALLL